METYDAVILGSGHNGLILQAYLSRAGLETICLERRDVVGGGLATIEHPAGSGYLHNTHSFYHRGITQMPWYRELELAEHGANYIQPDFNVAMICGDGTKLEWWSDFDKTLASFASLNSVDAQSLDRWRTRFQPIVRDILIPEAQSPPLPPDERRARLQSTAGGRLLLEVSELSPLEFVQREFRDPRVQAGLLFFNGLREVDLRLRGFGHHIPALLASDSMAQMCLGGSRRLADALVAVIEEHGGKILTDTTPREIVVERGRATGVTTTDGELIHARKLIASSLNPQQTFLQLIDKRHLPNTWIQRARDFQYNLLAPLFGVYWNLEEPPNWGAENAFMVILGLEHAHQFSGIVESHERGRIPPTVMWGSCPTQFDSTQAPPGKHTLFMWQKLPYHVHGNAKNWPSLHSGVLMNMHALLCRAATNIPPLDQVDWLCRTPLDTQQTLWNMHEGDLLVGAFAAGQIGYHRPFPGAGNYRGHLAGLYLCGSCCHPGGNVTGLPGFNAARVILADLNQ